MIGLKRESFLSTPYFQSLRFFDLFRKENRDKKTSLEQS